MPTTVRARGPEFESPAEWYRRAEHTAVRPVRPTVSPPPRPALVPRPAPAPDKDRPPRRRPPRGLVVLLALALAATSGALVTNVLGEPDPAPATTRGGRAVAPLTAAGAVADVAAQVLPSVVSVVSVVR